MSIKVIDKLSTEDKKKLKKGVIEQSFCAKKL